jgi:enterochelin esterase-like enzyme
MQYRTAESYLEWPDVSATAPGQVRGVRVVCGGSPCGVDLLSLRRAVMAAQPDYRNTEITDPRADPSTAAFETEYRAALELDAVAARRKRDRVPGETFPQQRVLYDSSLLLKSPTAETTTTGQQPGKKQRL